MTISAKPSLGFSQRVLGVQRMLHAHIRFYTRHFVIIACLAAVWLLVLFVVGQSSVEVTVIVVMYGEVVLPAVLAVIAAGVVFGDASRELLLIPPYRLWKVVVGRVAALVVGAARPGNFKSAAEYSYKTGAPGYPAYNLTSLSTPQAYLN